MIRRKEFEMIYRRLKNPRIYDFGRYWRILILSSPWQQGEL